MGVSIVWLHWVILKTSQALSAGPVSRQGDVRTAQGHHHGHHHLIPMHFSDYAGFSKGWEKWFLPPGIIDTLEFGTDCFTRAKT